MSELVETLTAERDKLVKENERLLMALMKTTGSLGLIINGGCNPQAPGHREIYELGKATVTQVMEAEFSAPTQEEEK